MALHPWIKGNGNGWIKNPRTGERRYIIQIYYTHIEGGCVEGHAENPPYEMWEGFVSRLAAEGWIYE